jgi:hypothetical protein
LTLADPLRVGYLAGSGHTGSTLTALLMDTHPRIVSVGETAFTTRRQRRGDAGQICSCGRSYLTCPFWQQVFEAVNRDGFDLSPFNWSNDYRYRNRWLHRMLTSYSSIGAVRRLQDLAANALPVHRARMQAVNRVNVSFIHASLQAKRADVFFDSSKRTMRLRHLLAVPELNVRVLKLVRDVRGYVASAKRRGEPVDDAARSWLNDRIVIDEISRLLPADRVMLLRYEDMCRGPRSTLRRVHEFLGVAPIDPPRVITPRDHHVLGNRIRLQERLEIRMNDTWRTVLSPAETSVILRIAGDMNQRLGYA